MRGELRPVFPSHWTQPQVLFLSPPVSMARLPPSEFGVAPEMRTGQRPPFLALLLFLLLLGESLPPFSPFLRLPFRVLAPNLGVVAPSSVFGIYFHTQPAFPFVDLRSCDLRDPLPFPRTEARAEPLFFFIHSFFRSRSICELLEVFPESLFVRPPSRS